MVGRPACAGGFAEEKLGRTAKAWGACQQKMAVRRVVKLTPPPETCQLTAIYF